jgi:hypothetical protein
MRIKPAVYFVLLALVLSSCNEYNKILKSTDRDFENIPMRKKYFRRRKV